MAEVTYYWNVRAAGTVCWAEWTTDPDYIVDNILTTYAATANSGCQQGLQETNCDGTDLGTVTKVEVRAYGYGDGNDRIDLCFAIENPDIVYQLTMPSTAGWSAYADVTADPHIDGWTWAMVSVLPTAKRLFVVFNKVKGGGTMYCAKVEIRVTYTLSGGAYYHGFSVQPEGELALCDAGTNPLRIRKGGVTYGIELVDTGDGNASRIMVKTGTGIKAIRKYT